ncbi:UPF0172 protein [Cavenderia fasciculata]|uniref:UPF0172 protein n=1 Tax=Cavenderia fasciculata TaxID=261658 RepID=F4PPA7_CACFS|nr:UPF0172 protein [Cavenderia fasciculata]EGG22220.1 UPF0172 protein [Cavenderia fasciculata]|eukprot:XP_004360071.1 UPF0172 protein [Cavenderia fasciculata]
MGGHKNIEVTIEAFKKIHSHSFKYLESAVNGILLGTVQKDSSIIVNDIIPLFHNGTLLPMFEVAMIQIEEYCKVNQIDMVGYYHITDNLSEKEVDPMAKKILEKLSNELHTFCFITIVELDNDNQSGLISLSSNGNSLAKQQDVKVVGQPSFDTLKQTLKQILTEHKETKLNDFEDYLSNPTLDWLNKPL